MQSRVHHLGVSSADCSLASFDAALAMIVSGSLNLYYNKPTQDGLKAHFTPSENTVQALMRCLFQKVIIYDIPGRHPLVIRLEGKS